VIGDVGQNSFEEIDYEPAGRGGRNYGWRNREGAHNNVTSLPPFSVPLTDPIFEYGRSSGGSITGGFVYRGSALGPTYRGRYFFGDFVSNRIWSIQLTVNSTNGEATASDLREHTAELGAAAQTPASFGVDAVGELYVVSYAGSVHRIVSTTPPPTPVGPRHRPPDAPVVGIAVPRATSGSAAELLLVVVTENDGRRMLFVRMSDRWVAADVEDEAALRAMLAYVRAGSMSMEIWRQRP